MPVDALFLLYPLQREEFPARQLGRYSDEVVRKSECPLPRWHGGPISPYSQPPSETYIKRHSLSNHACFSYLKHTASDSSASTRDRATGGFSPTGTTTRICLTTQVLIFLSLHFHHSPSQQHHHQKSARHPSWRSERYTSSRAVRCHTLIFFGSPEH